MLHLTHIKRAVFIFLCLFSLSLGLPAQGQSNIEERLIVFMNSGNSEVNRHFRQSVLPEIRTMAKAMHLTVSEENLDRGAPEEVGITPLIIYQNHLGLSVYQGRSNTMNRIKNFIRTSRRIPQGKEPQALSRTPIWRHGRGAVWSPLKISDLGGTQPVAYTPDAFQQESITAICKGFSSFHMEEKALMKRSDRGFYMDFYPWRGQDGTLFISLALYSQFHCKKPVFELRKNVIQGPYDKRADLFKEAGRLMEDQAKLHIADALGGDGFDFVDTKTPLVSFESLGYALPLTPAAKASNNTTDIVLSKSWRLVPKHGDDEPVIQFRFPPPLDNYSGEFKQAEGSVLFPENLSFSGMTGSVAAHSSSVTMGEEDLDKTIKDDLFLDQTHFPVSDFHLIQARSDDTSLRFGRLSLVNIDGTFQLKGKTIPLSLPLEMEVVLDENDRPLILVRGSFPIDLKTFNIEGATGPEPQRNTLLIDLNLTLEPAPVE
ncbi:MAG: YceI family protein [Proteobacteria bacterium]|nr:YceI family protein [Pseudomonadota bacterium]